MAKLKGWRTLKADVLSLGFNLLILRLRLARLDPGRFSLVFRVQC